MPHHEFSRPLNDTQERQAFRRVFDTYKERLFVYIKSFSGSDYIAEEMTQEVFVKLWQKRKDLGHVDNLDQYIFRIAKNKTLNYLIEVAADAKASAALKQRIVADFNPSLEKMYADESAALIQKAVASLPPQRRKIYEMSRKQGLKLEEIAAELNLTRSTAKNHLTLALRDVREYLVAHGYPLSLAIVLTAFY